MSNPLEKKKMSEKRKCDKRENTHTHIYSFFTHFFERIRLTFMHMMREKVRRNVEVSPPLSQNNSSCQHSVFKDPIACIPKHLCNNWTTKRLSVQDL